MKQPNCSICTWIYEFKKIKGIVNRPGCAAQGYQDCAKVYNSKACKKLYVKEKEE